MSQFAFLQAEFTPVFEHARKAEVAALSDPRAAYFYARLALETAVKWMVDIALNRDLLLPKLMSGEIRLQEAEKAVEAAV